MHLEIDEGFPEHRKTLHFCELLENSEAWSHLIRFWRWACRNAKNGSLAGMTPARIEIAMGWRGERFTAYRAAVAAGFIVEDVQGHPLVIHDWMDRTGSAIARMELAATQKKVYRQHKSGSCGGVDGGCHVCLRDGKGANSRRNPRPRTVHGRSTDGPGKLLGPSVQSSPVQSSPVQSSPVQSSQGADPDPERARVAGVVPENVEAAAPSVQPPPVTAQERPWRTGFGWLEEFRPLWARRYRTLTYGNGGDGKAARTLEDDVLAKASDAELQALWGKREEFIKAFLESGDPYLARAKHPFALFVTRWGDHRPDVSETPPAPRPSAYKVLG